MKIRDRRFQGIIMLLLAIAAAFVASSTRATGQLATDAGLLSDPFLQLPTEDSVRVVWFTEFPGVRHAVAFGRGFKQEVTATTTQLTHAREDEKSRREGMKNIASEPVSRPIWRHEAQVSGLSAGQRLPYRVSSTRENGEIFRSNSFTLAAKPKAGTPLKILLTSDHQLMPMVAANFQKVAETVGQVDAIFMAGDLVNIPDRASEWFDDARGGAFFPALQGRARYKLEFNGKTTVYRGGALLQSTPFYSAIGNHEVMGRYSTTQGLNEQFSDSIPRSVAAQRYQLAAAKINPHRTPEVEQAWIKANSFNSDTYEEIFTLPESQSGGEKYYAVTFGDIRLISLFVTNIWRSPDLKCELRGRYCEGKNHLNRMEDWGYGQHIFEPIAKDSEQYKWLQQELNSPEFKQAKYKIVMFHHPAHTLGDNIVPPYTDPVPIIEYTPDKKVQSVRYHYPIENDYIIRDLEPLLNSAGVQLVYYGHSHVWNRFVNNSGVNFLESSNVGNTYGAYLGQKQRSIPPELEGTYIAVGDPNGLKPIVPTLAPLTDNSGQPLPYFSSNEISAFSIFDTERGKVSSYRFDTRDPSLKVVKFDEFSLLSPPA
ncbi:metallophosphoesterase [Oscillatoria sp. FACHB-1406]|uniref:metallophosphoesterase family protein n=1 Tax=Oscillatoria sp. FACHB-1406 TaxID=2692846 RepID=UPI0016851E1F|nr:metallophosphoesterase [Oscillatoria sp. FACHB-1406]MBD2577512.1 metallophosphoesterase [Oscillatoria sp. FACHB-1406]